MAIEKPKMENESNGPVCFTDKLSKANCRAAL